MNAFLTSAVPPRPNGRGAGFKPLPGFEKHVRSGATPDELLTPTGQDAILFAVRAGLGILVSLTSDGGALSVTVYDGGETFRSYAATPEEAEALWSAVGTLSRHAEARTTHKTPR